MKNSKTRKIGLRRPADAEPLHADELIALEAARYIELPARAPITQPTKRRLIVSALDAISTAPTLRPARDIPGAYIAESSSRWVVGALGRSGARLPLKAAPRAAASSTPPKRPRGIEYSYLPRIAPRRTQPLMRSLRGGLIKPENIYGNSDERTTFWPSGYPWHCTGRLFVWTDPASQYSMSSGSAVLVGPRHVLTAGHMCPWGQTTPWMMVFVPGYYDGHPVPKVDSYVSDYRGWYTGNVSGRDMAILRLYDPLGDQLGWFGSKMYETRWQDKPIWSLIGWPGSIGNAERPTFQGWFPVLRSDVEKNALELLHRAVTTDGNSGGPLYAFWPDGYPYVIGTHSGTDLTENKDFNAAAGGQAMIDLIRWGLANWP